MLDNDPTPLPFTLSDRDMIRDTHQGVKDLLTKFDAQHKRLDEHHQRLLELERIHEQGKGAAWVMRLMWIVLVAAYGALGWHISKH